MWGIAAALLVFVGVVVAVVTLAGRGAATTATPAIAGPGQFFPSQGHCHIGQSCPSRDDQYENYPYNSDPPTSGPHEERFPTAFILDAPLPKRILIHIQEHGNVVILYNKHASAELVDQLRAYARAYDQRYWYLQIPQRPGSDVGEQLEAAQAVFVAPYPDMPHTIALVAWTRLDGFDTYDQTRIDRFVQAWVGNAQNARQ